MSIPVALRSLIETGPLCHLATINPDGTPQVTVVWVGADGDELVTAHMNRQAKLRNIERDPRVVLSFAAPNEPGVFLNPYAVVKARASIEYTEAAWELLDRLAKVYIAPDADFPAPRGPGHLVRHRIERVSGVGPWAER
jgi:PPOX class probable F420-dependent enzyme